MVSIIVAMARNRVIGRGNDLPWDLPDDLKHFRVTTSGKTVIMGRKTFESIVARIGKPLPNRKNIVVTRNPDFNAAGAEIAGSIDEALKITHGEDVFIIGGAQIYEQALSKADRVYLTEVNAEVNGDTYFPELNPVVWTEVSREHHAKDDRHEYDFDFVELKRR